MNKTNFLSYYFRQKSQFCSTEQITHDIQLAVCVPNVCQNLWKPL